MVAAAVSLTVDADAQLSGVVDCRMNVSPVSQMRSVERYALHTKPLAGFCPKLRNVGVIEIDRLLPALVTEFRLTACTTRSGWTGWPMVMIVSLGNCDTVHDEFAE